MALDSVLRLDCSADDVGVLPGLPQRDGQVLGPVGVQQGHPAGALLGGLVAGKRQVGGRALRLGLKHLLKLLHVQLLQHSSC